METDVAPARGPEFARPASETRPPLRDQGRPAEPPSEIAGRCVGGIKDLYATLIATRNLEIGLFWQRANYFLVLNSGLALGYFNLKETRYAPVFALVGLVASGLWFWVCLGGKYWQTRWEQRLMDFEANNLPGLNFFSAESERLQSDVSRGLSFHEAVGLKRLIYERLAVEKPSVSFAMILLSLLFFGTWAALSAIAIYSVF